jgi:hypothetical protein
MVRVRVRVRVRAATNQEAGENDEGRRAGGGTRRRVVAVMAWASVGSRSSARRQEEELREAVGVGLEVTTHRFLGEQRGRRMDTGRDRELGRHQRGHRWMAAWIRNLGKKRSDAYEWRASP